MKLFWVTTDDHDEDWFVVASSSKKAERYFENYEGYCPGDANAEEIFKILSGQTKQKNQNHNS